MPESRHRATRATTKDPAMSSKKTRIARSVTQEDQLEAHVLVECHWQRQECVDKVHFRVLRAADPRSTEQSVNMKIEIDDYAVYYKQSQGQ
jgi:hypothetical protein